MTREEAIEILQGAIKKPNTKDGYLGQAIDMAIKALEQEPCEEAVSKKEALSCFTIANTKGDAWQKINELPSVTPIRPKGHWIDKSPISWVCDKCNYEVQRYNNTNFCPNCGAEMKEVKE